MDTTLKPSLQLTAARIAAYAITFFIPLVLVRVLDPAQFGAYKQLFLLFSTLYGLGQVGMAESLYYFLPQFPRRAASFVSGSLTTLTLVGLILALALSAFAAPLADWLGDARLAPMMPLVGLFVALTLGAAPLEITLISRQRFVAAAWACGLFEAAKAAFLLGPAVLFHDVRALVVGALAFAATRWIVALIVLRREFGGLPRPSRTVVAEQCAYAAPFALYAAVELVKASWHQYVVAARVDAATFAIYAIGCVQIPLIDFVAGPAGNVMMVDMRTSLREGRDAEVLEVWHATTVKIAAVVVPLVVLTMLTAHDLIVTLFTERYVESVPVLLVWCPSLLLTMLQTDGVLRVFARTRTLLVLALLQLLVIASTVGWCLSRWSLPGAALATGVGLGLGKLAALSRIRHLLGVRLGRLLPWARLAGVSAAAAVAALVTLGVESGVDLPPPQRLVCAGAAFAATYAGLLLAWWAALRGGAGTAPEPSSCVESQAS